MKDYDDIIDIVYPFKLDRERMSLYDRASQFAPFAALTGYDALIDEIARLTDCRIEMSDDEKAALDRAFNEICNNPGKNITVTFFLPDSRKAGGAYLTEEGRVKKIETLERRIIMDSGRVIPLDDIVSIHHH